MSYAKVYNNIFFKRISNKYIKCCYNPALLRRLSNEPAQQPQEVSNDHEHFNISTKVNKRKPAILPFAKNLFLGKLDSDLLAYPEVLDKDQILSLENRVSFLEQLVKRTTESKNQNEITKDIFNELKSARLYGLNVPQQFGGLEMNTTETCRIAEVLYGNSTIGASVTNHLGVGLEGLLQFGTDEQKKKYLSKAANGQCIAAFCITEPSEEENGTMQTWATISEDGKHWILNGEKVLVYAGYEAGLLTVYARTEVKNHIGDMVEGITAFLVDADSQGIEKTPTKDGYCTLLFNNVHIPTENVLKNPNQGIEVAMKTVSANRLFSGAASVAILRRLLATVSKHVINNKQLGIPLKDSELVHDKLAKAAGVCYAIESMVYFTAGLLDGYENPECTVETAMIKVFSAEKTLNVYTEAMQILGPYIFLNMEDEDRTTREILIQQLMDERNNALRMIIALSGLQYSGMELHDTIKKMRNPLMNPGFVFRKMFEQRSHTADDPSLRLNLFYYVHPTLEPAARWMEYSLLRLQYITEVVLSRNGPDILTKQMELNRLCDVAINVFAMAASISRASRSYCIGLQNSDYEFLLANTFCWEAMHEVKTKVKQLDDGPYANNDNNYSKVGRKVVKSFGVYTAHPLTRNFF